MTVYEIDEHTNRLSKEVLDASFYVHTKLGPGLLESVYVSCVAHLLTQKGFNIETEKTLPVVFDTIKVDAGFRLDMLVEDRLIVEFKAVEKLLPVHEAQLHTYLKLSGKSLGLLLNFNVKSLKDGIKRIAMSQNEKRNFV